MDQSVKVNSWLAQTSQKENSTPATSMQAQDGSMVFCIVIHLIETHCDVCFILTRGNIENMYVFRDGSQPVRAPLKGSEICIYIPLVMGESRALRNTVRLMPYQRGFHL